MSEEQKGFVQKTEEDIKAEVIEDLKGDAEEIDVEANADLIDRITQRRLKDEEFKASVHAQKIERGEKAKQLEEEVSKLKSNPSGNASLDDTKVKTLFKELREEEALEELGLSPEIKEKVKLVSTISGVSVKKAYQDSYIQSLIKEEENAKRNDEASINKSNKAGARIDFSKKSIDDFDLSKAEDREKWDKLSSEDKEKMVQRELKK